MLIGERVHEAQKVSTHTQKLVKIRVFQFDFTRSTRLTREHTQSCRSQVVILDCSEGVAKARVGIEGEVKWFRAGFTSEQGYQEMFGS